MLISGRQRKVIPLNKIYDGTGSVEGGVSWYIGVLSQYGAVLVGILWYWVSTGRYCLVHGDVGSVWGCTGWYLVVLGQYNMVLLGMKWNWVSSRLLCQYIYDIYILKKWRFRRMSPYWDGQMTNKER